MPEFVLVTDFLKYLTVFLFGMFKFFFAPATGVALGLGFAPILSLTVAGMMSSVVLFTFFGQRLRRWYIRWQYRNGDKKMFSRSKRRMVRIWKSYGMPGVAILTPPLLTPVGGTVLAVSFGESRWRIFIFMLLSAIIWGIILTILFWQFGEYFLKD